MEAGDLVVLERFVGEVEVVEVLGALLAVVVVVGLGVIFDFVTGGVLLAVLVVVEGAIVDCVTGGVLVAGGAGISATIVGGADSSERVDRDL